MSVASRAREAARNARVEHSEGLRARFPIRDGSEARLQPPTAFELQEMQRVKAMYGGGDGFVKKYKQQKPRAAKGAARKSPPHIFKRIKKALGLEK